jgi:hypothetical protein
MIENMTCTVAFAIIKRCQVLSLRTTAGWLLAGVANAWVRGYRFGSVMRGLIDLDCEVILDTLQQTTSPKSR